MCSKPLLLLAVFTAVGATISGTREIVATPVLTLRDLPVLNRLLRLDCTVSDLPFHFVVERLSYTWYKDYRVIEGQSKSTLLIPSLSKEDGGVYSCTARYGHVMSTSPQSNEHEVHVLVPPVVHMEPTSPNNTITWAAGKILTLTCKVTEALPGVPSTGYSWSYLPSPQGQLRPLEARESTLTLGPVMEEDSGQYFCQARSDPDFQGELPPGKASVTVDVVYLKNINLTSDLEVNEGDNVVLTCAVKCKPKAHLVWSVGGREFRHVTANVDHYVVERAACSDSKTYTCRASNVAVSGLEKTASTRLLVNCSQRDSGGPADAIKIAVPITIVIAVLVSAGIVGFILWRKKLRCDRADADNHAMEPLRQNNAASQP